MQDRRKRGMIPFLAVGCCLALLATACLHPRKATWQRLAAKAKGKAAGNIGGELFFGGPGPPLVINDTNVVDYIAGTVTNGDVQVSYSPSLHAHAALLAQLTEHSLTGARALAGMPLPTRLHPYLIHLPGGGRDVHFSLSLSNFQQSIPWVIPLTNVALAVGSSANRPDAAILHDLDSVPGILFVITHELSEMTLVNPGNPLALGDYTATWGFAHHTLLHWTFKYHTLKVKAIRPGSPSAAAGPPRARRSWKSTATPLLTFLNTSGICSRPPKPTNPSPQPGHTKATRRPECSRPRSVDKGLVRRHTGILPQ